jgi:hypothetical protein
MAPAVPHSSKAMFPGQPISNESIEATIEWLYRKGFTGTATDFRFSPDSNTGLMAEPDVVLSVPRQRAKKQTRDQIQTVRHTWSTKPVNVPLLITDAQWAILNDTSLSG